MEKILLSEAAKAVSGEMVGGDVCFDSVATDSRLAHAGSMFIAIQGEKTDGHSYIQAALDNGSVCAMVCDAQYASDIPVIKVNDTVLALGKLASWYRGKFCIPIAAVTGSVGKTTTKEFCAAVLSQRYKTLKTKGNFNNHIGLPLTLCELDSSYEAAVVEMGMNHFGELKYLSEMSRPDIAIITNIGVAHIENLGSREGILKAKLEILCGMKRGSTVIMCGDEPMLWDLQGKLDYNLVYYGIENKACRYVAHSIQESGSKTLFKINGYDVEISSIGTHNIYNALAAAALGKEMSLTDEEISIGLKRFTAEGGRQNIIEQGGIVFIDDTYNANPDSMKAAISVLKKVIARRKIAVLSDMLELGTVSEKAHLEIGDVLSSSEIDAVFCFGELSRLYSERACGVKVYHYENKAELARDLIKYIEKGDAVLFKGSRATAVETILREALSHFGGR